MARTNLSLGNLYRAVSGSNRTSQQVSIGGLNGGGTNIAFTSFSVDSVTANLPLYTYIVENSFESASFSFGTQGSSHATKVATQINNYTASFNNSNFGIYGLQVTSSTANFPITASNVLNTTSYSEAQSVLTLSYYDGFNLNATNHGAVFTKTVYAVDVYNTINQPDFCLLFGTKIHKGDGSIINIEDLQVGDTIKAWIPNGLPSENLPQDTTDLDWRFFKTLSDDGTYGEVSIRGIVFNFADAYFSINGGLINGTGTHPMWVWNDEIQQYGFKNMDNILPKDRLVKYDEVNGLTEIEVTDIEIIKEDVEIVTIDVETSDVFLANDFVSHNKGTTSQPYIPSAGLRTYIDPSKTACFQAGTLPSTGSMTVDVLDLSGYGTGFRGAFQSGSTSITGKTSPIYNNGGTRKQYSFDMNGTSAFFFKDTTSNINGGYTQYNTNAGSIHMWVRPTAASIGTTSRYIFDYAGYFGMAIESTNSSAYNAVKFYGSTLGNSTQLGTTLTPGTWYLISVVFQSAGTGTIYVDGTSIGTFSSSTFAAPSSTNYITIGANSAQNSFWNGQVGPVLFYNTAQSSTAVTQIYNYFSPTYK
jgi:hypothetical protein